MARRKVTPDQVVAALRKIELAILQGVPVASALRSEGLSTATYYRRLHEYGGMNAEQVRRLMELKDENMLLRDRLETLRRVVIWNPAPDHATHHHGRHHLHRGKRAKTSMKS